MALTRVCRSCVIACFDASPKSCRRTSYRNLLSPNSFEEIPQPHVLLRQARHASSFGPGPPQPGQMPQPGEIEESSDRADQKRKSQKRSQRAETAYKVFETAATTFASIAILGLAGFAYHRYYKWLVLKKMQIAFNPGDPVLDMAALETHASVEGAEGGERHWIRRREQKKIDGIVDGTDQGHYHLLIGEKGTGKSSMLLDAMAKIDGEGVAMFEAHADPEIFRIRLGKALNYEFHEDYIGSFFSMKGPRDTTALLDIERAFNKLEKIALHRRKKVGRPLIIIVNSMHLIRNDEDGRDLLELMQQRAEQWAASNLVTFVFNSDDYWVYERLKQLATRMEVMPVLDLHKDEAVGALLQYRSRYFSEAPTDNILNRVYEKVGGRLNFLSRVARAKDMLAECERICEWEKNWLLNQCWILGEEMDDDVMDQQKYCSAAMVLAKALVDREEEEEIWHPEKGHIMPEIPLHEARQIMTRADFIQDYDHINIFTIDSRGMVRADSVPMQNAFREICSKPGFSEHLDATLERIAAIESLGRTREILAKDLIDKKYRIKVERGRSGSEFVVQMDEPKRDTD